MVLLPFAWRALAADRAAIRRDWKLMAVLGVMGVGVFNTFVYIGLGTTTATNALLLNSAIPVFIVLIGWLFMGQRVGALQAAGILISMAGVAAIITRGDLAGLLELRLSSGDIWILTAMVDWAVYTLLLRRRPADISPLAFLATTMAVGLGAIAPFYFMELASGARITVTPASLGAMAYIGVFPSLVAYLFWNRAVAEVGANRAGIFIHLMPVFGTLLAIVFLGEAFRLYHAAGIALILAGIVLTTRNPRQMS
jgi:drug/metabolite transporter (DMT)-like permease